MNSILCFKCDDYDWYTIDRFNETDRGESMKSLYLKLKEFSNRKLFEVEEEYMLDGITLSGFKVKRKDHKKPSYTEIWESYGGWILLYLEPVALTLRKKAEEKKLRNIVIDKYSWDSTGVTLFWNNDNGLTLGITISVNPNYGIYNYRYSWTAFYDEGNIRTWDSSNPENHYFLFIECPQEQIGNSIETFINALNQKNLSDLTKTASCSTLSEERNPPLYLLYESDEDAGNVIPILVCETQQKLIYLIQEKSILTSYDNQYLYISKINLNEEIDLEATPLTEFLLEIASEKIFQKKAP